LGSEDEEVSGRPIQVTIPKNVYVLFHSMTLINGRISSKKLLETPAKE
jgi:hypothetical protein